MSKIGWLISNVKSDEIDQVLLSDLASSRLRAGSCITGALRNKHQVLPLNVRDYTNDVDVLFIGKYVHDSGAGLYLDDSGQRWDLWLNKIHQLKSAGSKIVVDYTDNHFISKTIVGDFYRLIKKYIDVIVVPSDGMKRNLIGLWSGEIYVIPEPIEVPVLSPRQSQNNKKTLLWFGHSSNLIYLYRSMLSDILFEPPDRICIVTNALNHDELQKASSKLINQCEIRIDKWSVQKTIEIACESDYLYIPSDILDARKNGASSGRLITGLALGLPVIASPLSSYMQYEEYFFSLGSDKAHEVMKNPALGIAQVKSAQENIVSIFSKENIENSWSELINRLN